MRLEPDRVWHEIFADVVQVVRLFLPQLGIYVSKLLPHGETASCKNDKNG